MSTYDVVREYRIRLWLCAWAMLIGAVVSGYAGFHVKFDAPARPEAVRYAEGYALWKFGVCTSGFPIRVPPKPCSTFAGINQVAIDRAQPADVRELAYSFFTRTRTIAFHWIPGGALACAVLLWVGLAWRNSDAWRGRPRTRHRDFFDEW